MAQVPTPYKRFVLFGIDKYDADGGSSGVRGSFDTVEEAKEFIRLAHQLADARSARRPSYECREAYELLDRIDGVWEPLN